MDKKKTLILLILLCGCANKDKDTSCLLKNGNMQIDITINSHYDEILSFHVKESFLLPYRYLLNEDIRNNIESQLDDLYYFEENRLIKEYDEFLDKTYSLDKTVEYLRNANYVCR